MSTIFFWSGDYPAHARGETCTPTARRDGRVATANFYAVVDLARDMLLEMRVDAAGEARQGRIAAIALGKQQDEQTASAERGDDALIRSF